MANLKLLTSDSPNLRYLNKISLTPIVVALNTWHLRCLQSTSDIYHRCGHSFKVDYYALGILLYELLYGISPFYAPKKEDIFMAIMNS
jgi:serine/threonine protein kinase